MRNLEREIAQTINMMNSGGNCEHVADELKGHLYELLLSKREIMVTMLSDSGEPDDDEGVITNWRDLKAGDIVEVIRVTKASDDRASEKPYKHLHGKKFRVVNTDIGSYQNVVIDYKGGLYIDKWRFIGRP